MNQVMVNRLNIPWIRISAESIAIVASILVAFAIDAWWDERQSRINEAEFLLRLHAEIETNLERMNHPAYRVGFPETIEFYEAVESGLANNETSLELPTLTLRRVLFMASYEADTPILNGLIGAGRIDLIEDVNVVAAIARWENRLRNYTEVILRTRSHLDSHLIPALIERGDIGPALAGQESLSSLSNGEAISTSFRIDAELKGILGSRIAVRTTSRGAFGWTRDAGDELLQTIINAETE